jgi:hypothetical protein
MGKKMEGKRDYRNGSNLIRNTPILHYSTTPVFYVPMLHHSSTPVICWNNGR